MKSILHQQFKQYNLIKKKSSTVAYINTEEGQFRGVVVRDAKVNNARLFYCASKINAIVRGYLDRLFCHKLLRKLRAAKVIQRLIRGKLGRIQWQREYWKSLSVVHTPEALEEILARSKIVRERYFNEHLIKYHWYEYFDPLTESFWYYNRLNKRNTWEIPYCFQIDLVCNWNGYESFGSIHSKPCRAIFATRQEYYNHLQYAHRWYCVACFTCNSGIQFPTCSLCNNKFNVDGISGEKVLKENITQVNNKLNTFLRKDLKKTTYLDQYNLRNRLIDIATFYREHLQQTVQVEEGQTRPTSQQLKQHNREVAQLRRSFDEQQNAKNLIASAFATSQFFPENKESSSSNSSMTSNGNPFQKSSASLSTKLPPIPGATGTQSKTSSRPSSRQMPPQPGLSSTNKSNNNTMKGTMQTTTGFNLEDTISPLDTAFIRYGEPKVNNGTVISLQEIQDALSTGDMYAMDKKGYLTANTAQMVKQWNEQGGYEGEQKRAKGAIERGVFDEEYFQVATSIHNDDIQSRMLRAMIFGAEEDAGSDSDDDDSLNITSFNKKRQHKEKGVKLLVCPGFVNGTCEVKTCPLAHPGVRDNAKIFLKNTRNEDGSKKQVPYVYVCPDTDGINLLLEQAKEGEDYPDDQSESSAGGAWGKQCPMGRKCTSYHVYMRPSTTEIIRALYPIRCGKRQKNYESGAKLVGNVRNDEFDGYGTMTWENGAVYMGDWKNNLRHGFGIYRTKEGNEYTGQYSRGLRHGWGLWKSPNGDEYIGRS